MRKKRGIGEAYLPRGSDIKWDRRITARYRRRLTVYLHVHNVHTIGLCIYSEDWVTLIFLRSEFHLKELSE